MCLIMTFSYVAFLIVKTLQVTSKCIFIKVRSLVHHFFKKFMKVMVFLETELINR